MRLIALRGFAGEHAEDTLGAVRQAVQRADAVEVDARRCASGEVVVVHDETVDRVTEGAGRVADLTRNELAALSVLGSGEGVPTLAEVAAAIPDGVGLVAELKEVGLAEDALSAVGGIDDVLVSSFLFDVLIECREAAPDVSLALNVSGTDPRFGEDGIALATELDCDALHPRHAICSSSFVRRAHDVGLVVNAWTVEDRRTARELAAAGVDGVVADRADVVA